MTYPKDNIRHRSFDILGDSVWWAAKNKIVRLQNIVDEDGDVLSTFILLLNVYKV